MTTDNTITTENSGEEIIATTEASAVEDTTTEADFLAGFSDSEVVDEQPDSESDSKEEFDQGEQAINDEGKQKQSEPESHSRPDRYSRGQARIQQLIEQNRAKDAELAELRAYKAEREKPQMPQKDEDGNIAVDDLLDYNKRLIEQEMADRDAQMKQQMETMAAERDLESAIGKIQLGIADRVKNCDFLDNSSESYNPQLESAISERAMLLAQQLRANGHKFSDIGEMVLEQIDSDIAMIVAASEKAQAQATRNLEQIQGGGAITSANHGAPSSGSDEFLDAFNSQKEG